MMAADFESPMLADMTAGSARLAKSRVSPLLAPLPVGNVGVSSVTTGDSTLRDRMMYDAQGRVDVHFSGEDLMAVLDALNKWALNRFTSNLPT